MSDRPVSLERDGALAVMVLDDPPLNLFGAATAVRSRSTSEISIRLVLWTRGTTSACPAVAGLMSMNDTVCSSESMICAGTSPATMPQNRQSLAIAAGA